MGVAGVVTKPLLFVGTAAAKPLLFAGGKVYNFGAKALGFNGATGGAKLAYGAVGEGVAGMQGSGAKINSLFAPAYEKQQSILKAIKIENGGTLASQSDIINEVGKLMVDDPIVYLSYKRLQSQGTKVIFDFDPALSASNVRGVYNRINNTVKINVRANKNSREVVSTIVHEAHHQKTHFNSNVSHVNTIYEEYQAFRREFLMEQGRRPNLNEKNKIWNWVYDKYSTEAGYKDFQGNIRLGFSKDNVPDFIKSKLPSKGVSYSE